MDLSAFAVARHIRLNGNPTAVAAHPTRPFVYALTPDNGAVHEIEADRLRLRRKVTVGGAALSMRLAPNGESLFVLCREPRSLVRVALDRFAVDAQVGLPEEPHDFDLTEDGFTAGISFGDAGSLSFADLNRSLCERPIAVGSELGAIRFRPDGKALIAANLG
ncbi:MAG: YncE family protein, partial [Bryobacteraceae bacterium]